MVKIAQASIDEHGNATGGKAGNQNGKELNITGWYSHNWHTVMRPKKSKVASKIASNAIIAVHNQHIGYNQNARTTLYKEAKKVKFDLGKIKTNCDTDCSALVAVVCIASGIDVNPNMYTGNEVSCLNSTGEFEMLTEKKYLTGDKYLQTGDILVCNGHTVIVCSTSNSKVKESKVPKTNNQKLAPALFIDKKYKGTYVTTTNLNMRSSTDIQHKSNIIDTFPKGSKVTCYGYYNMTERNVWLLCICNGTTGYMSIKYLKKG
jgi:hypothetical protein